MLPRPRTSLRSSLVETDLAGVSVLGPRPTVCCNVAVRIVAAPSSSKRRSAPRRRDTLPAEYGAAAPPHGWLALLGMRGKMIRDGRATRVGQGRAALPRRDRRREHRS